MRHLGWSLPFLLFLLLVSCKRKDEEVDKPQEADFYPLETGNYRIYNVKKSTYLLAKGVDSTYQLKESIGDTFKDETGHISYQLLRWKKPLGVDTFHLDSVWTVRRQDDGKVIVTENNVPYTKLLPSLYVWEAWNGNAYNAYPAEQYLVTSYGTTQYGYPYTVAVQQHADTNYIYWNYRTEVYAKNVGLVHKESKVVNFSSNFQDFKKYIITDGVVLTQQLIEYGKE